MLRISLAFLASDSAFELVSSSCCFSDRHERHHCVRGTLPSSGATGTFPWSAGVRACCLLLLQYAATGTSATAELAGHAGSPAASLDSALAKTPAWLLDVFGTDPNGASIARRIFRRTNPERKRPGPVRVSINERLLSPCCVDVLLDGSPCSQERYPELIAYLQSTFRSLTGDECAAGSPRSFPPFADGSESGPSNGKDTCVIAESDLSVVKSITVAWNLGHYLEQSGIRATRVTWNWSDDILKGIDRGQVHIALYNTNRTRRYIEDTGSKNVIILSDFGYSMGGKNFYVLARRDSSWSEPGLDGFLGRLSKGATIAVPERSDMLDNLLIVLQRSGISLTHSRVRIVRIPVSQGLEALELEPDAILIHGQNVRMKARFRGCYHEVLNHDLLPPPLQSMLRDNAGNCVVVSRELLHSVGAQVLHEIVERGRKQFYDSWTNPRSYSELLSEVISSERKYGEYDDEELRYVVKSIVFETYRFGRPA